MPFPQSLCLEEHFKQIIITPHLEQKKYFLPNEPVQIFKKNIYIQLMLLHDSFILICMRHPSAKTESEQICRRDQRGLKLLQNAAQVGSTAAQSSWLRLLLPGRGQPATNSKGSVTFSKSILNVKMLSIK